MSKPSRLWLCALLASGLLFQNADLFAQNSKPAYLSKLPPLIDRELFFGDPEISNSQLSPDGKFFSFIKPYKNVRNIWVKLVDQPFDAAKPVTADERPVPAYFWSQDGKYLLYVQDKGGNEDFHVYAVDPAATPEIKTGVPPARDLTPIEGVRAFIYAVPKNKPNEMLIGLNDRDPAMHDVYRLDIASGKRDLLMENNENIAAFTFDLEGNARLAMRQTADGGTEILRIDGDKFTPVYSCNYEETCSPYQFHKDGKRVYMITNKGDNVDLIRLILFDPATGKEELVESDPEGQVDFGGATFSEDTDELIATFYVGDRVRIYPKTPQAEKDLATLRQKLPQGELNIQSSTRDMRWHIVSVSRDVEPASVYLYDRQTGDVKLQYRSRPELKSEHLAPMQAIRYKGRDGLEIPAYLTIPKGVEPKNLPVVIMPHGGPWARDTWGYDSFTQFLANRGYAVLQPNFRGSTGYGKKFLNAGNKEWGTGAMQHDISDGVKYLVDQGIADPKQVAIFGGSYGGYATLAGLAFTPQLYAAGVSYVGPSNLITLLNSIPPYWGPIKKMFDVRLGNPEADEAQLKKQSPLFSAQNIKAPLLVIQGANDPRVKKAESEQIVVALRDKGHSVEYLLAEDEGHGFRSPENRLAVAVAMEGFFEKHLDGRAQKDMSAELKKQLAKLTVDVNTVALPDIKQAANAETAPLPLLSANAVQPMTLNYTQNIAIREQKFEMSIERQVKKSELNGAGVWQISSSTQSPMGVATDTFYIDQKSLLPVKRRSSHQGMGAINIDYSKQAITGNLQMGPQNVDIDVELKAPVLGDDVALEVTLAALPLAANYQTTIRVFDLLSQKVRPMSLKVSGVEKVDVSAGSFDAFKVELEPLDGEVGGGTIFVSQSAPRMVVRSEGKVPAMMGGGTVTTTLNSFATK
jgi:dipeptidyl aminopeptidase/acylaminoacyl peptidase